MLGDPTKLKHRATLFPSTTFFDLYPLLSRLRRDGLVETTWQESESGPPRRYYRLTKDGRRALAQFAEEWARFTAGVNLLLTGKEVG